MNHLTTSIVQSSVPGVTPQSKAVTSVPWPAMNTDLNPIDRIWDMLGRRILAREPPVQNIRQLEAALHRETPKPLLSLHLKGQLAGCSLGYRLYFCVSKP
jgi:hypothetical protein